ncbi:MAG: TldD/PmbA family protein [Theionarchaea archaeon]|nr:TldD/PmbA family protein [Theionarchaea archaeon]
MMDVTNQIVEKALALGATDVIAKGTLSRNQQVRFSTNKIDIAKTWNDNVVQVLLVYNKRVVFTEIRDFDNIDTFLETLVNLAKASKENPEYAGIAQGPFTYPKIKSDPRLKALTEVSDFVLAAVNKALEKAETTAGALFLTNEDIFLSSSAGVEAQDERTSIELSIRAFSQKEASGHSMSCSPTLEGFEPEKAGEEAGELSRLAKNPVRGDEGVFDIVFSPLFFGSVLCYSMDMASAFNVFAGRSMYVGKVGEPVASESVTITDTPSGLKQHRFDDEGVPTKENVVVEKGILKTYLHNTSTAAKVQTETTGNAGLVVPKPLNIHIKPGDYHKDELFEEVDHGLYLTNTWYTRFQNMQTGDFSTIPRDAILLIEKGEIAGSLKNIRVSDNLLNVYQSIEGVSKEQKLVRWWIEVEFPCISSHILAKKVNITRSTE